MIRVLLIRKYLRVLLIVFSEIKDLNNALSHSSIILNTLFAYLIKNSFSVGIRDLVLDKCLSKEINIKIDQQKLEVEKTIQTLHLNMFENMSSDSEKVAFENKVTRQLTAARSGAENLLKKCHDSIFDNRFMNMVNGGSKGKLINLAQMTACLGQQIIEGRRVPYGFNHRTLPHYTKFDDTSEARGFVHSSFQKGMNPPRILLPRNGWKRRYH